MRQDRFTRLDDLVAGRHDADGRLGTDADARHAGACGHRDLGCAKPYTVGEQQRPLPDIAATAVDVLADSDPQFRIEGHGLGFDLGKTRLLDRYDGITTGRQHGAGHDLDGVLRRGEGQRRIAGGLHRLDQERLPAPQARGGDGEAIHRDTIERRLVTLGVDVLAQHGADALYERQRLDR